MLIVALNKTSYLVEHVGFIDVFCLTAVHNSSFHFPFPVNRCLDLANLVAYLYYYFSIYSHLNVTSNDIKSINKLRELESKVQCSILGMLTKEHTSHTFTSIVVYQMWHKH